LSRCRTEYSPGLGPRASPHQPLPQASGAHGRAAISESPEEVPKPRPLLPCSSLEHREAAQRSGVLRIISATLGQGFEAAPVVHTFPQDWAGYQRFCLPRVCHLDRVSDRARSLHRGGLCAIASGLRWSQYSSTRWRTWSALRTLVDGTGRGAVHPEARLLLLAVCRPLSEQFDRAETCTARKEAQELPGRRSVRGEVSFPHELCSYPR